MADYYGDLASAASYMAARSYAWTGTDADKTAALIRASQYIDGMSGAPIAGRVGCRTLFPGQKTDHTQSRLWPRTGAVYRDGGGAVDSGTVPAEIINATYEAARIELATPGYLTPTFTASSLVKSEKVGPLETVYAVSENSGSTAVAPIVPTVNSLLYSLLITRCGGPAVFVV